MTTTVFTYLTVPKADTYRAVMLAFVASKRRFVVHLRPEDVHDGLLGTATVDDVAEALVVLQGWGNLRSDPDTSRVTTVEDFHRARYLYQLTQAGEAAESALAVFDEALGRRGALQSVALTDIATQLRVLLELARADELDVVSAHLTLRSLVDRFTDLAGNAQAFMGSLQRSIELHDVDSEAFQAYKEQLIGYLERFVRDLVATGGEIAGLVGEVEAAGVGPLLAAAAERESADVAPGEDVAERARQEQLWRERWAGVRSWFTSSPGRPSQAKLLRAQARAAIPALLQVVATLNERRSGRSDRAADFRALAVWFAEAPDADALHRTWRAAFGLSSARHLSIDADSLAAREDSPVSASTPWASAPPLRISPRLRATGSYERRGRPTAVTDRAEARRHLAELAARESAALAAARTAMRTDGVVPLSELGPLPADAFRVFLGLLGGAMTALRPGARVVTATTADGSMEIRLTVAAGPDLVELVTPDGVFRSPDHLVQITDLATAAVELSA